MCPRLINLYGPIAIQSYGFMIVMGLLAFLGLTYFHPRRKALIAGDVYLNAVFISLLAGLIGGRILGVITEWQSFSADIIDIFCPWIGGFVILGAAVAVVIVAPLYLRWHKVAVLPVLDFAAVYAPVMQAVARFGCLFAGCCYGLPCAPGTFGAVIFSNPEAHIPTSLLGIPLYPTQVYISIASLGMFFMMWLLYPYFKKYGQALFFFLMCENISRFCIDFWRGDRGDLRSLAGLQVSQFQIYSLMFFGFCAVAFLYVSMCGKTRSKKV